MARKVRVDFQINYIVGTLPGDNFKNLAQAHPEEINLKNKNKSKHKYEDLYVLR